MIFFFCNISRKAFLFIGRFYKYITQVVGWNARLLGTLNRWAGAMEREAALLGLSPTRMETWDGTQEDEVRLVRYVSGAYD